MTPSPSSQEDHKMLFFCEIYFVRSSSKYFAKAGTTSDWLARFITNRFILKWLEVDLFKNYQESYWGTRRIGGFPLENDEHLRSPYNVDTLLCWWKTRITKLINKESVRTRQRQCRIPFWYYLGKRHKFYGVGFLLCRGIELDLK